MSNEASAENVVENILRHYDLMEKIAGSVKSGEIPIEWRGHFRSGKTPHLRYLLEEVALRIEMLAEPFAGKIAESHESKQPLDDWRRISSVTTCGECGERIHIETNGIVWRCTTECATPKGVGPIVFELNVPSGKMVVANDLRTIFPVLGHYDINAISGIMKTTMAYAEAGLAHSFVGNTCPGVFKCGPDKFVIGAESRENRNPRWDQKTKSRRVGGVCTDLWWYSICDYDEFVKRTGEEPDKHRHNVVKCEPGVYQFKHVYHLVDRDNFDDPQVYAYIQRKRKPDKIKNYRQKYDSLNLSAGQIIAESIRSWPTLYGKADLNGIQRAADHVMCVVGNGDRYHPNGFWTDSPNLSNDSPGIDIPIFDAKYHWYPLSDYSTLAVIAGVASEGKTIINGEIGKVNDSFIELAFNVCRCILVHGTDGFGHTEKEKTDDSERSRQMAIKCMEGLKKKYPDKIPENCRDI